MPDAEAWVVRKTVIEVRAFPRYLEPLALATWCSGTGSHWAERRISIQGELGGAIQDPEAIEPRIERDPRIGDHPLDLLVRGVDVDVCAVGETGESCTRTACRCERDDQSFLIVVGACSGKVVSRSICSAGPKVRL